MTNQAMRQNLTDLAAHLREVYGRDAAALVELWRDQRFPENTVVKHRWRYLNETRGEVWVDRVCVRCDITDQYGPIGPDGKKAAHYLMPDGSRVRKSPNPTPPCRPSATLPSLSRSRKE